MTTCDDGGACHHNCENSCYRKEHCLPLSGSGLRADWTPYWPKERLVSALQTVPDGEPVLSVDFSEGTPEFRALMRQALDGLEAKEQLQRLTQRVHMLALSDLGHLRQDVSALVRALNEKGL